jgi:hypothetical protein
MGKIYPKYTPLVIFRKKKVLLNNKTYKYTFTPYHYKHKKDILSIGFNVLLFIFVKFSFLVDYLHQISIIVHLQV